MRLVRKGMLWTLVALLVLLATASAAFGAVPRRVLVVVMDQMHPQYAKQYGMTNVLWLQDHGVNFKNAIVGDMASTTVVSHNVIVSGMLPKHQGWSDEAFRDTAGVLSTSYPDHAAYNDIYVTGDLSYSDFAALVAAGGYKKLGAYLHEMYPGSTVACVGEKSYQVRSMTAGSADFGVFLGSATTADSGLAALLGGKYRPPAAAPNNASLPTYIGNDARFYVNSDPKNDYGTLTTPPAWIYPEDGDCMVPGHVTGHLGGDNWVADATMAIIDNTAGTPQDWSGLFVNLGGIDKSGHMWGGGEADTLARYHWDPHNFLDSMTHMPFIAKNADTQLGRIIGELKAHGELDETLIVVLADHGSTAGTKHFYGLNAQKAGNHNWYWGDSATDGDYYATPLEQVSPAIRKLLNSATIKGNVAFSYHGTAIETWLKSYTLAEKKAAARVMRSVPGVIATYYKSADGNRYILDCARTKTRMTRAEAAWWKSHAQKLVDTMAWSGSADVVGLLANRTAYGSFGDHGGAQKDVQRIPVVFYNPSLKAVQRTAEFHLADVMPTVMKCMGIGVDSAAPKMDGKAYTLPAK
ncbi:MAG TPA: sulfatase-like hydrolase/transferase [Thermoleophilia bacterium]|nr:sulfatase-like hydrolase/transferase [Thermoleophilia bacterium]HQG04172.1 sulfatase-like hydrolase/transferase [Thermoleophilia bacterium]HQJ98700.1 sulfatase-like hydrolase/transferase [Thermoleophilia bacterium]